MPNPRVVWFRAVLLACAVLGTPPLAGHAQVAEPDVLERASDLRHAHDRCVRAMVRLEREDGGVGSGWVAELAGRPVVVTNAHVVEGVLRLRAVPYGGEPVLAHVRVISTNIDLAILVPESALMTTDGVTGELIPVPLLEIGSGPLVRGQRVVLGGNPGGLHFITTEGVVAGVVSHTRDSDQACGEGHNCVVLDTEAEPGCSGGPIVDAEGRVIGMLWGVYSGSSLSIAIHTETLRDELTHAGEVLRQRLSRGPR